MMRIFKQFLVDRFKGNWRCKYQISLKVIVKVKEKVFKNLWVTNDVTERWVALTQYLNRKITNDKD